MDVHPTTGGTKVEDYFFSRLSLAKMVSVANASEISDFQEDEIEATRTRRSECNVTCPGGW